MHYIYVTKELSTGFSKADMSDKPWDPREGYKLIKTIPFALHKKAVAKLLTLRKEFKKARGGR